MPEIRAPSSTRKPNPYNAFNPSTPVNSPTQIPEEPKRILRLRHADQVAKAIDNDQNIYARYAIWLYLLTGLRKSELLRLQWSNIDWDRKELCIPEPKNGRPHYLPLSTPAQEVLKGIPRQKGNPHVFPGNEKGQPVINIDKAWRRIRARAGVEDVRLHDLCRTVGSWLAQSGNSLHLIGRVLNHRTPSTTQVYARFADDHVRVALEAYSKQLMGAAGCGEPAEIVDLENSTRQSAT